MYGNSLQWLREDKENEIIEQYIKSVQILENVLAQNLKIPPKKLEIPPSEMTINNLDRSHLKESFLDND